MISTRWTRTAVLAATVFAAVALSHELIYALAYGTGAGFAGAMTESGHDGYWASFVLTVALAGGLILTITAQELRRLARCARLAGAFGRGVPAEAPQRFPLRPGVAASALLAIGALPATALAHGLVGRLESPLPLAVYLAGAAIAVALSFGFVILRDVRASPPRRGSTRLVPRWLVQVLRGIGLLGWLWILAQTIVGGSSSAGVASLFLWVYGWVGIALLSAFVGPVWTSLDPFSTIADLGSAALRRMGIRGWSPEPYPRWLGQLPAVAGFAFFVWLELVYAFADLGLVLLAYTGLTLLCMAQFGKDAWRRNGETFSVWFGTLNRLAPYLSTDDGPGRSVRRISFATGLLEGHWTRAQVVLVALGTGSILYDGLSQTEPWYRIFGFPSLAVATLLLAAFLGLIVLAVLGVARLVGLAAAGAGLVPIALGYLVAHYITYLLGDGQRSRQVPLALLMVVLTTTTLWSLGQAIVVDPGSAAVSSRLLSSKSGGGPLGYAPWVPT